MGLSISVHDTNVVKIVYPIMPEVTDQYGALMLCGLYLMR